MECVCLRLADVSWMGEVTTPCPLYGQSVPWTPSKRVIDMEEHREHSGSQLGSTFRGWDGQRPLYLSAQAAVTKYHRTGA